MHRFFKSALPSKKLYHKICAGVVLFVIGLSVCISLTNSHIRISLIREGGLIETLSAIGYFGCLLLFMLFARHVKGYWSFAYLVLCMGLRELDLHHSFSKWSITSTKFWLNMEISIFLKLISAGILLLLIISAVNVIKKYYRNFILGLKSKDPTSICVCCGLISGMLAKVADDSYKKIEELNIGPNFTDAVWVLEECLELGIPILFFIAILAHLSGRKGIR